MPKLAVVIWQSSPPPSRYREETDDDEDGAEQAGAARRAARLNKLGNGGRTRFCMRRRPRSSPPSAPGSWTDLWPHTRPSPCKTIQAKGRSLPCQRWALGPDIFVLKHDSRNIRYFWLDKTGLKMSERATGCAIFFHPCNI